ncbi:GvpL/GvpF family gas vesicle protein [Actinacidiphila sp. bgisy160]|uniref:GvpL/GvpF family gas vesicle protein n=1 Tax=Actinacidiphila sp. bgisy160 TaxID=3413796 RepID=UPI003D748635
MNDRVSYAYAVLRGDGVPAAALEALRGVAGAPVRLVTSGALAAAVSPVPAADFREDALRGHLEDLDWLEAVARAHHTVIEALSAHTTVLPLRLATVYLDEERVRDVLSADDAAFSQVLDRLTGHLEWGVKIYVDAPAAAAPPGTTDALSPGRAYLNARRAQRQSRDEAYRAAEEAAARVEMIGRELAAGHARHGVQQGRLAAGAGENVLNDAFLVPREQAEAFRTRALAAGEGLSGVRVDVTGPWAPYSFAVLPGASRHEPDAADAAP